MSEKPASFEPFAEELAYIRVNERLVDRLVRHMSGKPTIKLLDIAAGTGLMSLLACDRAKKAGSRLLSTLLDIDLPALHQARASSVQRTQSLIAQRSCHVRQLLSVTLRVP